MSTPLALRPSLPLRATSVAFTLAWCLVAAFPIFWITVMSFKEPVDAFAPNPLAVIFGPMTRAAGKGLSILDLLLLAAVVGVGGTMAWGLLRRAFEDGPLPRRLLAVAATALAAKLHGPCPCSCIGSTAWEAPWRGPSSASLWSTTRPSGSGTSSTGTSSTP